MAGERGCAQHPFHGSVERVVEEKIAIFLSAIPRKEGRAREKKG
jgi:hypothetical protein